MGPLKSIWDNFKAFNKNETEEQKEESWSGKQAAAFSIAFEYADAFFLCCPLKRSTCAVL